MFTSATADATNLPPSPNALSTTAEGVVIASLVFLFGNCWNVTANVDYEFFKSVPICFIHFTS